jgi:acetylornithine/succinyldiaminopimelate/putrescine aminotransferase
MDHKALFFRYLAQTSPSPLALEVERAEGVYMYDRNGKAYLDMISGISVSILGHRHPEIVRAVKEQADRYMHLMVYGELVQSPQVRLARMLAEHLPPGLDNVFLVNSGSEAIEGAVKLAKRHTGRTEVVAFRNAYHGSTQGALSLAGNERLKNAFRPLIPGVRLLAFDREGDLPSITENTACVVAETMQGEAGAVVPGQGYLQALRKRCDETGTLLVLDEIQVGFGRTGKLWAFQHHDIIPDILCLAKGMGGGLPIGAFVAGREIMRDLTHDPVLGHITTFGGNAVCAAASEAMFRVLLENRYWEQVRHKEMLFRELLTHPTIRAVRGMGLLLAVEFETRNQCKKVVDVCLERGLLTDWFLFADNCMRLAPPLIISEDNIRFACQTITRVLDDFLF